MSHFNLPVAVVKNQPTEIDPVLKKKLKVYGKESAHTFVDQLFGGQLLSTVICDSCHHPYQILEPFMDLSLPVSEDKSPPTSHKRKTTVVDSVSCLGPSTPAPLSKHQRKKERKAGRRNKGRRWERENKEDADFMPSSAPVDEIAPEVEEDSSEKSAEQLTSSTSEVKAEVVVDEDSPASSGREDDEDDDAVVDVEQDEEDCDIYDSDDDNSIDGDVAEDDDDNDNEEMEANHVNNNDQESGVPCDKRQVPW